MLGFVESSINDGHECILQYELKQKLDKYGKCRQWAKSMSVEA